MADFAKLQILAKFRSKRSTAFFRRSRLTERLRGVCGAEFAKCGKCAIPIGSEKCKINTSYLELVDALLNLAFPLLALSSIFSP